MATATQSRPLGSVSWVRRSLSYALVLLIGFLIGFTPMWFRDRASAGRLAEAARRAGLLRTQTTFASAEAEQQLELAKMQNTLASAAIDARRGDYESARQAASDFFTSLRSETDRGADSLLSQAQGEGAQLLFAQQDELISLLARNDPAAPERLSDVYVSFRELMSR